MISLNWESLDSIW